jgi:hypothetical protein
LILPVTTKLVPSKVIFGFEQIFDVETYVPTPFAVLPVQESVPPPVVVPDKIVPSLLKYAIQVSEVLAETFVNLSFGLIIHVAPQTVVPLRVDEA